MNQLLHTVSSFIDIQEPTDNFYLFIGQLLNLMYKNDEIVDCFVAHPIEFTRLYEEMTDKLFKVEDEEITNCVSSCFSENNLELRKKCKEITKEILDLCGGENPTTYAPLFTIFYSLANGERT